MSRMALFRGYKACVKFITEFTIRGANRAQTPVITVVSILFLILTPFTFGCTPQVTQPELPAYTAETINPPETKQIQPPVAPAQAPNIYDSNSSVKQESPEKSPPTYNPLSYAYPSNPPITSPAAPNLPVIKVSTPPIPAQVRVVKVVDGDTIEVDINGMISSVRYIGIDTPDYYDSRPDAAAVTEKAKAANRALVENKYVRLEKDISETDEYGRLLRYVYVGELFINGELVKTGWAEAFPYPPDVRYANLFAGLQQGAKSAGIGIWASSTAPAPILTLEIVSVTSPVKPGDYATLNAKSVSGAKGSIKVFYKSGPSQADGLFDKTVDSNGNISWKWRVSTSTSKGSYKIDITVTHNGNSVTKTANFTVQLSTLSVPSIRCRKRRSVIRTCRAAGFAFSKVPSWES